MSPRRGRFVGVDVVDLDDPRCVGKQRDDRFLRRILADAERKRVRESHDPAVTLWRTWAAKEAAYKVISKIRAAPPPFVHAAFRVDPSDPAAPDQFGTVTWEDLSLIHI